MRGRPIFVFLAELHRLDASATAASVGYDPDFKEPVLLVMKEGWYERGKQALVAEGKRLFQAKTVLLDAKAGYTPEPEEVEAEVHLS